MGKHRKLESLPLKVTCKTGLSASFTVRVIKRSLWLLLVLAVVQMDLFAAWNEKTANTTNTLNAVGYRRGSQVVYAAGGNGTVVRSANEGDSWSKVSGVPTALDLNSVFFVSDVEGYVAGVSGVISKTLNSGVSWTPQNSQTSESINGIFFTSSNNGFYVANKGQLRATTNGGSTWQSTNLSPSSANLTAITFPSSNIGYAVGYSGTVLKTTDGGSTWFILSTNFTNNISAVSFFDDSLGAISTYDGRVLVTKDGGNSWVNNTKLSADTLTSITFSTEKTRLYTCGSSGALYVSTNIGQSWSYQTSIINNFKQVAFLKLNVGIVVGNAGKVIKTTDGGQDFPKMVTITSPDTDTTFVPSQTIKVKWDSENVDNVVLQYSLNDGVVWNNIGVFQAAAKEYLWVVPNTSTDKGKFKIYDESKPTISNISKGSFTIDNKVLTLKYPNGGEKFYTSTDVGITWEQNNLSKINIEYTLDNGVTWSKIKDSVDASLLSYTWKTPNLLTTSQAKIKIKDVNSLRNDISDSSFTITAPSLTLNLPKDSDVITANRKYTISWSAVNSPKVNILLSLNDGGSYDTLATNYISQNNTFDYIFGNQNIEKAKIRIENSVNNNIYIENSTYFSIKAVPIILTYPKGGEKFEVGKPIIITWTNVGINFVTVEYSVNNGLTWNNIIKNYPSTYGSYEWIISDTPSDNVKMRIYNAGDGEAYYDTTKTNFKIAKLKILSPVRGSAIYSGSNYKIALEAKYTGSLLLEYSKNRVDWITIADNLEGKDGEVTWNVPNEIIDNITLRVKDKSTPNIVDTVSFNIVTPSLVLIKPNGGEYFQVGRKRNIEWESKYVNKVNIQFSTNGGVNWLSAASNVDAKDGKFSWNVPNTPNSNSLVRIVDAERNAVNDQSNTFFTITTERVDVLSPNGTEILYTSQLKQIKWSAPGANKVDLLLSQDSGLTWQSIVNNINAIPNTYSWTVGNTPAAKALIKVRNSQKPDIEDESDKSFEIVGLSLITPKNTAEKWVVGNKYQIKWASHRVSTVNIQYSTNGGTNWTDIIRSYPAAAGYYTWAVPNTPTMSAKVRIVDPENTTFADTSSVPFTITGLMLTYPQGGEEFLIGEDLTVKWNSNNIDNINIELTTDNGGTWNILESYYDANLGSYTFTIPEFASNICRLRIKSSTETTFSDMGNLFTIRGNGVVIKSPNGGEVYQIGSKQKITWGSANVASVNIYYAQNGRTDWVSLAKEINPQVKELEWTVPMDPSTEYRVKIEDSQNSEIFDISEKTFVVKGVGFKTPSSWDVVSHTGVNSTIIIPANAKVTIGTRNIDTNDAIGVFYKREDGKEYCAGMIVWKSNSGGKAITIWGDNPLTPIKDGMIAGDLYVLKFWDAKEGLEFYANATYSSGTNLYSNDAISQLSALQSGKGLNLNLGANQWTLVSSNLVPENPTWKNLTSSVNDSEFRIKDDSGKLYFPKESINDLTSLEIKSAYLMYVSKPTKLNIQGTEASLGFYDFMFNSGRWYMMSYLPQVEQPIATVFNSISSRIILVKNPAGQVYYPSMSVNDIQTMKPGEGFRIAVNQNLTFKYPAPVQKMLVNGDNTLIEKSINSKLLNSDGKTKYYKNNFRATGNSAVWIVSSKEFSEADEVAAFTANGLIVGSGVVKEGKAFLTIWGASNAEGVGQDGADENEKLYLRVWRADKKQEFDLEVVAKADLISGAIAEKFLTYQQDAVWLIEASRGKIFTGVEDEDITFERGNYEVYPNPSSDGIYLDKLFTKLININGVNSLDNAKIEVISLTGNQLISIDYKEIKETNRIEVKNLENGVYFIKVSTNSADYYTKLLKR